MSEKDVIKETRPRMEGAVEDLRRKLATIRTGRAAVSLLDNVTVDYYGTPTPLNQMASVHAPEANMLTVQAVGSDAARRHREGHPLGRPRPQPLERRQARARARPAADRGAAQASSPSRCTRPPRITARPSATSAATPTTASSGCSRTRQISEDAERDGLAEIQKLTDSYIGKVDEFAKTKEQELMSV